MRTYYKKLFLLLIPACAGFCLALALGSAEQPTELCHLCQNKALVKEAILAFDEDPYDANLPYQFDSNYRQRGPDTYFFQKPHPHLSGAYDSHDFWHPVPVTFKAIIAEGDMVAVHLYWWPGKWEYGDPANSEMAIYRIANGKIVEAWVSTFVMIER